MLTTAAVLTKWIMHKAEESINKWIWTQETPTFVTWVNGMVQVWRKRLCVRSFLSYFYYLWRTCWCSNGHCNCTWNCEYDYEFCPHLWTTSIWMRIIYRFFPEECRISKVDDSQPAYTLVKGDHHGTRLVCKYLHYIYTLSLLVHHHSTARLESCLICFDCIIWDFCHKHEHRFWRTMSTGWQWITVSW